MENSNLLLKGTTCNTCKGFGIVYPVVNGKVDYSTAVYCQCHPKAGTVASKPVQSPDIIYGGGVYVLPHEPRPARVDDSVWESPEDRRPELPPTPNNFTHIRRTLDSIRGELAYTHNKLNEHLDNTRKYNEAKL